MSMAVDVSEQDAKPPDGSGQRAFCLAAQIGRLPHLGFGIPHTVKVGPEPSRKWPEYAGNEGKTAPLGRTRTNIAAGSLDPIYKFQRQ